MARQIVVGEMSQTITVPDFLEPKTVKLAGQTYKLPGDIPAPLMLQITTFGERVAGAEDGEQLKLVEELYEEILSLFRVFQPDLESLPIGTVSMVATVNYIYTPRDEDEPDEPGPMRAKRSSSKTGTRSTSRRQSSRSRS